jgi:hypothetical protein
VKDTQPVFSGLQMQKSAHIDVLMGALLLLLLLLLVVVVAAAAEAVHSPDL